MNEKWRVWDAETSYGEVLYKRAIGELPEMESSKKVAKDLRKYVVANDRILDVGCGAGHYLRSIRREIGDVPFHYTGVDATRNYIELARRAFPDDACDFMLSDIFDIKLPDRSYDVVTCNNVLLHLPSIEKPLSELIRVSSRNVLVRLLSGERSFQIKDVAPNPEGRDFDENGEPVSFHFYNIYSNAYLEYLLSRNSRVKKWSITPDFDFDKNNILKSVDEHGKAHDASKIVGDYQLNGYVLQPWSILEIEVA